MAKRDPRTGELLTTNYSWTKPTVGSSVDAWGGYVNADLDAIDSVVHGIDIRPSGATISDAPPASPQAGRLWYDSVGGQLYTFYNDGNSSQWVPTTNQLGGGYLPLTGGVMTGPITPAGIVGVTDGSNALAGQVGEYKVASFTSVAAGAMGAVFTIGTLPLTAGDWDVEGIVSYLNLTATNAIVNIQAGVNNSAAFGGLAQGGGYQAFVGSSSSSFYWNTGHCMATGTVRLNSASAFTAYLLGWLGGSNTTGITCGGSIRARRVR